MIANENSALRMIEVLTDRRLRKRPPSQRDRDIAAAVRVQGRRQVEVAAEFGLSRRRVSQICRKIEEWHGSTASWERGEGDIEGYRQADRILHRDQLTEIYGAALRAYARSEQPLVTRRSGQRGDKKWSDRSQRQQRLDTGSLRVALKAIEMQWKLADRPFKEDEGKDEKARLCNVLSWVAEMLEFVRKDAETRGVVPRMPGGPKAAVERMLRGLLGVPEEGGTGVPPVSGESSGSKVADGEVSSTASDRSRRPASNAGPESPPAPANRHWQDASATPASRNSSMGSVWETPWEAHSASPAAAASDDAAATCGAAAAAGSALGSAPQIEMGNVSRGTGVPPVSGQPSGSNGTPTKDSSTANDRSRMPDGNAGLESPPAPANPHWQEASATPPTRLERLLNSSRHLSRGHRRRPESLVAHRRGDAHYAEGVTDH